MTTKLETRPVYSEADLDRLVAGDRVILDILDFYSSDGIGSPTPVAYGGRVGKNGKKIALLQGSGREIEEISAKVQNFSFDTGGVIILNLAKSNWNTYNPSSPEYENKLTLLKQAGLY